MSYLIKEIPNACAFIEDDNMRSVIIAAVTARAMIPKWKGPDAGTTLFNFKYLLRMNELLVACKLALSVGLLSPIVCGIFLCNPGPLESALDSSLHYLIPRSKVKISPDDLKLAINSFKSNSIPKIIRDKYLTPVVPTVELPVSDVSDTPTVELPVVPTPVAPTVELPVSDVSDAPLVELPTPLVELPVSDAIGVIDARPWGEMNEEEFEESDKVEKEVRLNRKHRGRNTRSSPITEVENAVPSGRGSRGGRGGRGSRGGYKGKNPRVFHSSARNPNVSE
jgi:hypothetical protein